MSTQAKGIKTPWHLWVLGGLLLVFNGFAAFDYIATVFRFQPYLAGHPEEVLTYYYQLPVWMYALLGGSILGGFFSALFLLLRRKIAIPLFALAWLCSCGVAVYDYIDPSPLSGGVMSFVIILAITLLILVYMIWLSRRGVLR